ncbi:MAG: hypothetical protein JRJ24_11205 [Deltaproteobacteria bacterium]|nr:hypothetical protein [Deltaproteobacteria bacterium]
MALAHFDNALLYAWDQRWRKSWTRRRNSFNAEGTPAAGARAHAVDRLVRVLLAMRGADLTPAVDDEQLAFALDATAYEGSWQIYLALFPNIRAMYRFATLVRNSANVDDLRREGAGGPPTSAPLPSGASRGLSRPRRY